ncbi:SapC family protein [Marinobacterium stanieri]|uniref:SapC family protein n=1 Tax=Marinobacterium stanieri TaxID=49186 RepID=UPI003A93C723
MSTPENNQRNTGRSEVLSPERHGSLRFHKANNFAFAAEWLYVPVHYKEAGRLARQFPVLFYPLPSGGVMPCMLLKTKGKSALSAQMNWQGSVLPDVMRLYPFGFSKLENGLKSLALYPAAPHFSGKGEKIITSKGKPTQRMRGIIKQLMPVEKAFEQTQPLMKELLALKVLQPMTFSLRRGDGKRSRITLLACPDFSVIKNKSLSSDLRTLLYIHQQSCRSLFKQIKTADTPEQSAEAKPATVKNKPAAKSAAKSKTSDTVDVKDMIKSACDRFGVSLDDLRSRKRSDAIKRAREALATDASACDCLPELAIQLERSVDTIKKWV